MTITEALNVFDLGEAPTDDVVKRRYRDVARVVHPDRNAGNEETATRLIKHYTNARAKLLSTPQQLRVRQTTRARSSGNRDGNRRASGNRDRSAGSQRANGYHTHSHDDLREQVQNVAAFSQWLTQELPTGRAARVLFGGTALLAFGSLVYKVLEDSRSA